MLPISAWLFSAPLAALTWLIDVATNFISFSCPRCIFSIHTPALLLRLGPTYDVKINPGSTMSLTETVHTVVPVWFPPPNSRLCDTRGCFCAFFDVMRLLQTLNSVSMTWERDVAGSGDLKGF